MSDEIKEEEVVQEESAPVEEGLLSGDEEVKPVVEDKGLLDEDEGEDDSNEEAEGEEEEAEGAPEEYETPEDLEAQMPEGVVLDREALEVYDPLFKECDLSQSQRDKFIKVQTELARKRVAKAAEAEVEQRATWKKSMLSEPNSSDIIAKAKKGLKLADPAFAEMISAKGSWMGVHPGIIKTLARLGELGAEDSPLDSREGGVVKQKSLEDRLYSN